MEDPRQVSFCVICRFQLDPTVSYCPNCGTPRVSQPGLAPTRTVAHFQRSRDHRIVAGVLGGLAMLWHLDVAVTRILWIAIALIGLPASGGVITVLSIGVYVALWVLTRDEPAPAIRSAATVSPAAEPFAEQRAPKTTPL